MSLSAVVLLAHACRDYVATARFSRFHRKSMLWDVVVAFLLFIAFSASVCSQNLDSIAQKVHLFGTQLPQEKVFIHTDNTAYFLGDTIFYQAYVTRTDRGTLSSLSGVLYVELLNADGYLVERQIVRLTSGLGSGSIILHKGRAHYAGFYELRAYTRWMLNFGRKELSHNKHTEDWFVRKHMAKEFYVDYDKMYSRTFPVYDAPLAPGEYYPDMTERPMQRMMGGLKKDESVTVSVYPEGGHIVAGLRNRLYFEALNGEGRHVQGELVVCDDDGRELARSHTEHRGKGMVDFIVPSGKKLRFSFQTNSSLKTKLEAPVVRDHGAVLRPSIAGNTLTVDVSTNGMSSTPLFVTIMHEGVVVHNQAVDGAPITKSLGELPKGVLDITVYDEMGRIWADRLVFNSYNLAANRLMVEGLKKEYAPYEQISLEVAPTEQRTFLSISLMDGDNSDQSADNGNILTELLLASEIKGFIEQPTYYFEADDSVHRRHLDLLMATQGWRRFNWVQQSHPERFVVSELNEPRTPRLNGAVYNYEGIRKADELQEAAESDLEELMRTEYDVDYDAQFQYDPYKLAENEVGMGDVAKESIEKGEGHFGKAQSDGRQRYQKNPGRLKKEVTVHAEFVTGFGEIFEGEADTGHSMFNIEQPKIEEQFYMHLAAADTTKWKTDKGGEGTSSKKKSPKARRVKHTWISPDEGEYPEFYVRLADPFPRHAQPYSFYRTTLLESSELGQPSMTSNGQKGTFDDRVLDEVTITSGRKGKRRFDRNHPALALSAYTAFNSVCDAGLCPGQFVGAERLAQDVARMLFGDMGVDRQYRLSIRRDGLPESHTMSVEERAAYNKLENLDSVFIFTDYAPRHYGNPLWAGENQPDVVIDVRRFPNKGMQVTYRDRFYVRQGFNLCEDFYHPDYSVATPPPHQDHRRTLAWFPFAVLNPESPLVIRCFNNGKTTHPRLIINGITSTGTPLTN